MMGKKLCLLMGICGIFFATSCAGSKKKEQHNETTTQYEKKEESHTLFNAERTFSYIQKQVDFGPRVPNTDAHKACASYLIQQLQKRKSLSLFEQPIQLKAYDGTLLQAKNIIASYAPERPRRILLFAHWDTRPIADHDPDKSKRSLPIDGADDGASGTAVLLEIAHLVDSVGLKNIGVDIALFDAEDYGLPEGVAYDGDRELTWALGTQYWSKNPHQKGYSADFGILLDMVGAKGATFYKEYFSTQSASRYVNKIWSVARKLGYARFFINEEGGAITDDHYFVIQNRAIPCVDIINYNPKRVKGFGNHWHTHKDNMDNIDLQTLQAVGATVWRVLEEYDNGE